MALIGYLDVVNALMLRQKFLFLAEVCLNRGTKAQNESLFDKLISPSHVADNYQIEVFTSFIECVSDQEFQGHSVGAIWL